MAITSSADLEYRSEKVVFLMGQDKYIYKMCMYEVKLAYLKLEKTRSTLAAFH